MREMRRNMVTIKDISRKCGVSPATVSKALNGYGDISKTTVELVKRTAQEMHYLPNAAARQLKTNASHNIGVIFVDETNSGLTHEYFAAILNSAREEAELHGYDITFLSNQFGETEMSFLEHCRYRKCDGVLIASVDFLSPSVVELVRSEVPVVTIDYAFDSVSSVMSDNVEGGYALARHILDCGHKKIAFIHGEDTSVTRKRMQGFFKALAEDGVQIPDEYLVQGRYHDPDLCRKATVQLMKLPDPPTAILFPDDFSYLGGMLELERMNLSVPENVSVAGYDGINTTQVLRPKLTTYFQNAEAIGRASVKKLIETIEHKRTSVAEEIKVTGKLITGQSVKNLKD